MSSFENDSDYWVSFWNNNAILENENLQCQIGRTINKNPINTDTWLKTVDYITEIIELDKKDELIDICSGNGLLSIPFAQKCKYVTAVDVSEKLLSKIDISAYPNVKTIVSDVRTMQFEGHSFSKAILYFALQHFNERETILIYKLVYNLLKPNGLFYIGDIPDSNKYFDYFNTKERQMAYFESILTMKPIIGSWFSKRFLENLAIYVGFKKCTILDQPDYQINSHYRFDILLEK